MSHQVSAQLRSENETPSQTILLDEGGAMNEGDFNPTFCGNASKVVSLQLEGGNGASVDRYAKWRRPDTLTKTDFRFSYNLSDCP